MQKQKNITKNPIRRIIKWAINKCRSKRLLHKSKYVPDEYWKNRLSNYGLDLRGVGNCTLTHDENISIYSEARDVFLKLCRQQKVDFSNVRALDIGCGTGFYAQAFMDNGGKCYQGIDITDALFDKLQSMMPDFKFRKLDITSEKIDNIYDFIMMIDVTQHIVDDEKYSFAMKNIKSHLANGGIFIVTFWEDHGNAPHVKTRPFSDIQNEFSDCEIGQPLPFRDKSIVAIKKTV